MAKGSHAEAREKPRTKERGAGKHMLHSHTFVRFFEMGLLHGLFSLLDDFANSSGQDGRRFRVLPILLAGKPVVLVGERGAIRSTRHFSLQEAKRFGNWVQLLSTASLNHVEVVEAVPKRSEPDHILRADERNKRVQASHAQTGVSVRGERDNNAHTDGKRAQPDATHHCARLNERHHVHKRARGTAAL